MSKFYIITLSTLLSQYLLLFFEKEIYFCHEHKIGYDLS